MDDSQDETRQHKKATNIDPAVPYGLRLAAAVGWRFLVLVGALVVLGYLFTVLATVVVPVAVALLLAALLAPAVGWLVRKRVPRGVATAVVMVAGLAIVGGVLTFVVNAFTAGLPELEASVAQSLGTIQNWLRTGPLHLSQDQFNQIIGRAISTIRDNQAQITSGALSTATTVGELLTELLLVLFTLIFLVYDGKQIWHFLVRGVPKPARARVDRAGVRAFASLVGYVRATAVVAVVDAAGIGIGLAIIGVPLAVPLAALVFLGAFIPIVGAVIAGTVAVLVALVAKSFVSAMIVLAIVIAVMQVESHILQPLLLGRAVRLHPLAVVLSISSGLVIAGIAGALLAVPLVAVVSTAVRSLAAAEDRHGSDAEELDALDPEHAAPDRIAKKSKGKDAPAPASNGAAGARESATRQAAAAAAGSADAAAGSAESRTPSGEESTS